jgi:plastocyanin
MKIRMLLTVITLAALLAACAPATGSNYAPAPATSAPSTSVPINPPATSAPVVSGSEVKVDISGFAFNPGTITIKVGQTVTWTNNDSVSHNVKADDGSFSSSTLATGDSFSFTFNTAGTYTYKCGFHANMLGTVIVQP